MAQCGAGRGSPGRRRAGPSTLPRIGRCEKSGGVPSLLDVLERFRPTGAPGAATSAGVPADRRADASAELEPVFAELAGALTECERIRQRAVASAGRRQAEAAQRVRVVLSGARAQCAADRAAEAALLREQAEVAFREDVDRAAATTAQLRDRAQAHRSDLVAQIVRRVRDEVGFGP